jgi:uncharacterized SAM-binding protein YcdF (DUF218 family)
MSARSIARFIARPSPLKRRRRPRNAPRRLAAGLVGGLAFAALLWAGGFLYFLSLIPSAAEAPKARTDAVVVLTGGAERLAEGLRLLNAGLAARLFVSGVPEGIELKDLLAKLPEKNRPRDAELLQCCIVLGHAANNTAGNAAETASWLAAEEMRSLRLVTADYHMPRSLLEFRKAVGGALILAHPVFPQEPAADGWRGWTGIASILLREYAKYSLSLARAALGPRAPEAGAAPP